jgi:hypothetical protein
VARERKGRWQEEAKVGREGEEGEEGKERGEGERYGRRERGRLGMTAQEKEKKYLATGISERASRAFLAPSRYGINSEYFVVLIFFWPGSKYNVWTSSDILSKFSETFS